MQATTPRKKAVNKNKVFRPSRILYLNEPKTRQQYLVVEMFLSNVANQGGYFHTFNIKVGEKKLSQLQSTGLAGLETIQRWINEAVLRRLKRRLDWRAAELCLKVGAVHTPIRSAEGIEKLVRMLQESPKRTESRVWSMNLSVRPIRSWD